MNWPSPASLFCLGGLLMVLLGFFILGRLTLPPSPMTSPLFPEDFPIRTYGSSKTKKLHRLSRQSWRRHMVKSGSTVYRSGRFNWFTSNQIRIKLESKYIQFNSIPILFLSFFLSLFSFRQINDKWDQIKNKMNEWMNANHAESKSDETALANLQINWLTLDWLIDSPVPLTVNRYR